MTVELWVAVIPAYIGLAVALFQIRQQKRNGGGNGNGNQKWNHDHAETLKEHAEALAGLDKEIALTRKEVEYLGKIIDRAHARSNDAIGKLMELELTLGNRLSMIEGEIRELRREE